MFTFLRRIWQAAPVATVILGGALVVSLFFAVRLVAFWIYWADPAHRDQAIEPWMTPGYVAHSWDVPREVAFEALNLPPAPGRPLSLQELAEERGVSVDVLAAQVQTAINAFRAEQGPRP
ncbi:hypothetical protein [Nioella sp.]|uniref:hypothetical protein n=1 Tax=Nioella sp. TaxID=1912091 RepID=UPI003B5265E2